MTGGLVLVLELARDGPYTDPGICTGGWMTMGAGCIGIGGCPIVILGGTAIPSWTGASGCPGLTRMGSEVTLGWTICLTVC